MSFKIQDDKGFTLLELMLVVALMGLVTLGVAELIDFQSKSTKTAQNSVDFAGLQQEFAKIILKQDSCTNTFENLKAGDSVRYLRDRQGAVLYDATATPGTNTAVFPLTEYVIRGMRILTVNEMAGGAAAETALPPSMSPSGAAVLALRVDAVHQSVLGGGAPSTYGASTKTFYQRVNAVMGRPLQVRVHPATTEARAREICNTVFPDKGMPNTRTTQPEFPSAAGYTTIEQMALSDGVISTVTMPSISSFMSYEFVPGVFNGIYPARVLMCSFASFETRISSCIGNQTDGL